MPLLTMLMPIIKITITAIAGVIAEGFLRKNTQIKKRQADIEIGREALKAIDQITDATVHSIEQSKKYTDYDNKSLSNLALNIVRNALTAELRKEANCIIIDIDAYIIRKIEASVLIMNLQKKEVSK